MSNLEQAIQEVLPRIVSFRRDLHAHPELGYEEVRTSTKVKEALSEAGISFVEGLAGGTGVLAYLPATQPTEDTIALRADMDALPIIEQTGLAYGSTTHGKMHACGHDGHTAALVGTALALKAQSERNRNVLFLFQPAEEGGAGGKRMVEDGALSGKHFPKPRAIFGLHGFPNLKIGELATKVGPMMASAETFEITVHGKGAHAAAPHTGIDPVVVASHIILALQSIASRGVDPLDSVVVSVTMVNAGTAHNIISERCDLKGTLRTLTPETREYALAAIDRIAENVAAGLGARAEVRHFDGYPVTVNSAYAVDRFKAVVSEAIPGALQEDCVPTMGGEDFSFYGAETEACFFWLGLEGDKPVPNLHSPYFDYNDDALPVAMRSLANLALAA